MRAGLLPPPKPNDTEPILFNEKAKKEEKADGGLSSKVLLQEKLKQSNSANPVVPSPIPAFVILTKNHWLKNLDVPWNSCKTCKYLDLIPESLRKDDKSISAIDFQKRLYILEVYIYFYPIFDFYDKYLVLMVRCMLLKITFILGKLKIRLDAIWDARINS